MDEWAAGSLLRHRTLGRGKVVAVEPTALHVFFPDAETRFATKLRWPIARPFLAEDDGAPDPWLAGLTSFSMDAASGRYALAANFVSHDEAVAAFAADHPGGFAEPSSAGRGAAWRAAGAAWVAATGDGQAARALDDGEYEDLAGRLLGVAAAAGSVPGLPDAAAWEEALSPGDELRPFLVALFGYLSVPSPARARFDALAASAQALGADPDVTWGLVTFFPFVAVPERHALLLAPATCHAAARLGTDLRCKASPTWDAYGRLRKLSARLLESLRPLGARDHVDVEVFLHATGARRAPAAPRRPASRPAARRITRKA